MHINFMRVVILVNVDWNNETASDMERYNTRHLFAHNASIYFLVAIASLKQYSIVTTISTK